MENKRNLWLLPTDKDSKLYLGNLGKPVTIQSASAQFKKPLHIYITNNEEIKEGDWCIDEKENVVKADKNFIFNCSHEFDEFWRKIILTDNKDLINDGVQAIDDEFLEWFVKNPSCESVQVDKNWNYPLDKNWEYKIIIPQEEPKQETLEEAAEKVARAFDNDNYKALMDLVIDGAKWQAERMYSEEDMMFAYEQGARLALISQSPLALHKGEFPTPKQWFEQFKKK
jgi:hypothetical protein